MFENIARFFYEKSNQKQDFEHVRYGLELIISDFLKFILLIILSMFLGSVLDMILIILVFVVFRTTFGGYHADSHWRCFIITILILEVVYLITQLMILGESIYYVSLLFLVMGSLYSMAFLPIVNIKRIELGFTTKRKLKQRSMLLTLINLIVLPLVGNTHMFLVIITTYYASILLTFFTKEEKYEKCYLQDL